MADQGKALDLEATADGIDLTHYLAWLPLNGVRGDPSPYAQAVRRLLRHLAGGSGARPSWEENIMYIRGKLIDAGLAEGAATAALKQLQPSENSEDSNKNVIKQLRKYFLYLADQGKVLDLEATADGIDLTHYLAWLPQNGVRGDRSTYAQAVRRLLRHLPAAGTPHDVAGAEEDAEEDVEEEEERIAQEEPAAAVSRQVKPSEWIRERLMGAGLSAGAAAAAVEYLLPRDGRHPELTSSLVQKYFHYLDDQGKVLELRATADGIDLAEYLAWLPENGVSGSFALYLQAVRGLYKGIEGPGPGRDGDGEANRPQGASGISALVDAAEAAREGEEQGDGVASGGRGESSSAEEEEAFDVGTSGNRLMSLMMERTDELLGEATRAPEGGEGDRVGRKQSRLSHTVCAPDSSRLTKRPRTSGDEMGPESPMLQ